MEEIIIHYADDDLDDLDLFKNAVRSNGTKAALHLYNNGDDLLDVIKKNDESEKAIVFLDLNMPAKSGFAVLKEMTQINNLKYTPVVIYSTSDDENAIMVSKEIGADLYVIKPKSFNSLKEIINQVVSTNWSEIKNHPEKFVLGK